jgi:DNA-binding beta-propeller fold protein YncE
MRRSKIRIVLAALLIPLAGVALGVDPPTHVLTWGSLGTGDGQFQYPLGIATDADGKVYVADTANHRIQKFAADATYVAQWGSYGAGNGQFQYPVGIVTDAGGNVYVADQVNSRIQKFASDGTLVAKWGSHGAGDGQFQYPFGVATDSHGNVYVADTGNHRIQKFGGDGTFLAKWGSYGTGDGQFNLPRGVATDAEGDVYVADTLNHRIQKFAPPIFEVQIDVKPGSGDNPVNPKSRGVIPVAILTTSKADGDLLDFDATEVDPDSVAFGPDGAFMDCKDAHFEDVDDDGDTDLLLHFRMQETGIASGDTEVSLAGMTYGGREIEGTDSIETVGGGKE